jgi:hypothetical protein
MSYSRSFIFLICIFTVNIFLAGCISQTDVGNKTTIVQTVVTSPSPIPTLTPCPPTNETPHIYINPISRFSIGDMIEITGTTNVDGILQYSVYSPPVTTITNAPYHESYVPRGVVKIIGAECNEKKWSFIVDSNNLTSPANKFITTVRTVNETTHIEINKTTLIVTHWGGSDKPWGEVK